MDALILKVHRAQSVAYVLLRNVSLYIKKRFKMIKYTLKNKDNNNNNP